MNPNEAKDAIMALEYPKSGGSRDEWLAAESKYQEQVRSIIKSFRDFLANKYANDLSEQVQTMILDKSFEDGHSLDSGDVESHYQELANFARDILSTK